MAVIKVHPLMLSDLFFPTGSTALGFCDVSPSSKREDAIQAGPSENGDFYYSMDLPGVKATDLKIKVDSSGSIHIEGTRNIMSSSSPGHTIKKARMVRSVTVDSQTVDLDGLQANLSDGVLVLTAPRKPKAEARVIPVTAHPHEEPPREEKTSSATTEPDKNASPKDNQ